MEQNSNYRVLSNVCVSCGVRIPDIDFEIKPAMRETYGLFLVTAGKGIFIIDGIEYPVKRGNSVMLFPYSSISVKIYPNIMFEYKWVELTGFEIAVMISRTNFSKAVLLLPKFPLKVFFNILMSVMTTATRFMPPVAQTARCLFCCHTIFSIIRVGNQPKPTTLCRREII